MISRSFYRKGIQTTIQNVGYYAPCGPNLSKPCVPCTFEFLISASPHPKLTTLGISLGGQPVKHRQLARQVGVHVEDPPASSMASFKFSRSVPSQGATFIFGSWLCIADGVGDFRRFLVDMKPKISAAEIRSDLDKFVDDLDNLSTCVSATGIEMDSAPGSTSSSVAATSPGLDSFQSGDPHSRSQLGSCKLATDLQEANVSGSLSMLEKDLDFLLQDGKPEATARRGASGCFGAGDHLHAGGAHCALEGHGALRSTRGRGSTCGSPRALALSRRQAIGYRGGGVD
jgi:hypothetical protein